MAVESPQPRHHAAGGWRRAVIGLLVGAGFGAVASRVVPADRSWPPGGLEELRDGARGLVRRRRGHPR